MTAGYDDGQAVVYNFNEDAEVSSFMTTDRASGKGRLIGIHQRVSISVFSFPK